MLGGLTPFETASKRSFARAQLDEAPVMIGNASGHGVSLVGQQAVAEADAFALGKLDEVGLALDAVEAGLVAAEGVGGHQPITATVPAGRMRVLGVGEDGQADRLAFEGAR